MGTIDLTRKVIENKEKVYNEVLIIGAGDMLIPHYLLTNFPNIKKLTVCEIDDRVVEVVKKYNGYGLDLNAWIAEGRLDVKIDDGANFVQARVAEGKTYDAIITDNTDVYIATGPAKSLFTSEFFKNINQLLNKDGCFSQ